VYFSPARAAVRADLAAVDWFFGMASSISGGTPRVRRHMGMPTGQ
jgi:hypothetical protein